jgi:hypothetical protein
MFSRPIFFAFVLSVVSVAVIFVTAQPPKDDNFVAEQKRLAEELFINNLIFDARSQTTPETAADALITIAESGNVNKPKLKRQLLEEAFDLAEQAQYPVKIRYMGFMETPTFYLYNPLELKLDKLALRSRVIKALLKFDKPRARKLFLDEMPPEIDLTPLGCENVGRFYDLTDYYETASAVFRDAFTPKERGAPGFAYILLPFIERMASPAQVTPVARMLVNLHLNSTQLSLLTASYLQALTKVRNDDSTFRQWTPSYFEIRDLIKASGEASRQPVTNAFREFLLKQMNGARCSDGIKRNLKDPLISKYELPGYIRSLNDDLLKEKPITSGEIEPESIVKATRPPFYWDSKKSSDRMEHCKSLRFKSENVQFSDEEKQSPEWQAELDKYLLNVGMWQEDEESTTEDYINKKSTIYLILLNGTVPRGAAWDGVLKEYLLFLSRNELRGESRLQWFWLIRILIKERVEPAKPDERVKTIDIIKSFKNPTMTLYCDLLKLKDPPAI